MVARKHVEIEGEIEKTKDRFVPFLEKQTAFKRSPV